VTRRGSPAKVLETDRLLLRRLSVDDAAFILELLNDPSWLRFIGDKGVRSIEDARDYIVKGPVAMYEREGFGLYLTQRKSDAAPIGLCGLIKRDSLDDVDIGFAFLPKYRAQGYAHESAAAVLTYGRTILGLTRIVAITSVGNDASSRLLEKLGMRFQKTVRLANDADEVRLYAQVCLASIRFDVHGTLMLVERDPSGWRLFRLGAEGKRSLVPVSIPEFIAEDELAQFLDDLFHEAATPEHPAVTRIR
jgi:RimJ/RimL family protein N-acetyltransferase